MILFDPNLLQVVGQYADLQTCLAAAQEYAWLVDYHSWAICR